MDLWTQQGQKVEWIDRAAPTYTHCCFCCLLTKACLTLCNPMDCSPPGFSVQGLSRQHCWISLPCPPPGMSPTPGCICISGIFCTGSQGPSCWGSGERAHEPRHALTDSGKLLYSRRLSWGLCGGLEGRDGGGLCVFMVGSHCCRAEADYTVKPLFSRKKKRKPLPS